MTANALSSSGTNPAFEIDLLASGRLPPLPTAWLGNEHRDLLAPVTFLVPDEALPNPAPAHDRKALAEALAVANAAYGHPEARALAEKLADPETQVVVTGQQPGLWGGPLLSLDKMLAAVRWAETLEAAGRPAVAVFWVATEDHDWAETARAGLPDRDGLEMLDLGDDPSPLLPVGMRTFGPNLPEADARARELLRGSAPGLDRAQQWYRPDARFGEAFCRLMVHLVGAKAPLMMDSMLGEVKELQRPWLRRVVERRAEASQTLAEREAEVEARGFALQVPSQPQASPLFLLRGAERRRILWSGEEHFVLRGLDEAPRPVAELLEIIDDNPAVVSPGVLARPAIQDALLGTAVQVMGPSEMSYMAQVSAVYPVLGVTPPASALRPQMLLLEERQAEYLGELDVSLGELLERPLEELLADRFAGDVVGPTRDQVGALLETLHQNIVTLDPSLEKPFGKTRDQIGRNLDQLSSKVAAAVARRHEVWHRRLAQIATSLFPGGSFQERKLSTLYALDRFGPDLASQMLDGLDLDPRVLRALRLTPAPRDWGEGTP